MNILEEITKSVTPKRRFVIEVTDGDGDVYFLPDGDDPVATFGSKIEVVRYELVNPVKVEGI